MQVTKQQIKQLQTMKSQLMVPDDAYRAMLAEASAGRTTSTVQLTDSEAQSLIKGLQAAQQQKPKPGRIQCPESDKMRKKILSYCHKLHWTTRAGAVDMERLNAWMLNSSYLHKPLMKYTYDELPALVSQFEKVYKSYLRYV